MYKMAKAAWINALKSGEYQQCKGVLTKIKEDGEGGVKESHCCLGVLCELAIKDGVPLNVGEIKPHSTSDFKVRTYDGAYQTLPQKVRQWAGIEDSNPRLATHDRCATCGSSHGTGRHTASYLNDTLQLEFSVIADLIDADL